MSYSIKNLKILVHPCNSGMCPALYQDEQGRVFVQGSKLPRATSAEMGIPDHEAIVEITPELIDFLRSSSV